MSTSGRQRRLEQVGKIVSFVLAWAIMGQQAWGTTYGREPNALLVAFAVCIIAPAALQYVLPGRGGNAPSEPPPSQASPSSSPVLPPGSESGGG